MLRAEKRLLHNGKQVMPTVIDYPIGKQQLLPSSVRGLPLALPSKRGLGGLYGRRNRVNDELESRFGLRPEQVLI